MNQEKRWTGLRSIGIGQKAGDAMFLGGKRFLNDAHCSSSQ
jgi:hypothetical protein